jgi:hypothetical protein
MMRFRCGPRKSRQILDDTSLRIAIRHRGISRGSHRATLRLNSDQIGTRPCSGRGVERAKVERRRAARPRDARSPRRVRCCWPMASRSINWLGWWLVGMPSCNGGALKSAVGKRQWSGRRSPTQGGRRSGSNRSAAAPHACGYALANKGQGFLAGLGGRCLAGCFAFGLSATDTPLGSNDYWRRNGSRTSGASDLMSDYFGENPVDNRRA